MTRIRKMGHLWFSCAAGPRTAHAVAISTAACLAAMVGAVVLGALAPGEGYLFGNVAVVWTVLAVAALFLSLFTLVTLFSRQPRSWDLALTAALASYDPLRPLMYQALQCKVKAHGFESMSLLEWVDAETEALDAQSPVPRRPITSAYQDFTEKQVWTGHDE